MTPDISMSAALLAHAEATRALIDRIDEAMLELEQARHWAAASALSHTRAHLACAMDACLRAARVAG